MINSDVKHIYGEAKFDLLCRCLANYKNLKCTYSRSIMNIIHGFRTREHICCAIDEIDELKI